MAEEWLNRAKQLQLYMTYGRARVSKGRATHALAKPALTVSGQRLTHVQLCRLGPRTSARPRDSTYKMAAAFLFSIEASCPYQRAWYFAHVPARRKI